MWNIFQWLWGFFHRWTFWWTSIGDGIDGWICWWWNNRHGTFVMNGRINWTRSRRISFFIFFISTISKWNLQFNFHSEKKRKKRTHARSKKRMDHSVHLLRKKNLNLNEEYWNDRVELIEKEKKSEEKYLLIEIWRVFEGDGSVVVRVRIDESESRTEGEDQRRFAARTISWIISDGFLSESEFKSFSFEEKFVTGGNFGIWGLISKGTRSHWSEAKNHSY